MVVRELGVEIAAEHVEPRAAVPLQFAPAQDLGDGARRLPAPHLELEQPVLRGRVALREEQVLLGRRVDVVDAPAVAPDLDRLRQPRHPGAWHPWAPSRSVPARRGRRRDRQRRRPERGRSQMAHPPEASPGVRADYAPPAASMVRPPAGYDDARTCGRLHHSSSRVNGPPHASDGTCPGSGCSARSRARCTGPDRQAMKRDSGSRTSPGRQHDGRSGPAVSRRPGRPRGAGGIAGAEGSRARRGRRGRHHRRRAPPRSPAHLRQRGLRAHDRLSGCGSPGPELSVPPGAGDRPGPCRGDTGGACGVARVRGGDPSNYRKDGTTFWNRLSIAPVRNASGEVTHFIGIQSDVTARRQAEDGLRVAKERDRSGLADGGSRAAGAAAASRTSCRQRCASPTRSIPAMIWPATTSASSRSRSDQVGLYVLDVSGHGVGAALLSFTLNHLLSPAVEGALITERTAAGLSVVAAGTSRRAPEPAVPDGPHPAVLHARLRRDRTVVWPLSVRDGRAPGAGADARGTGRRPR